MLYNSIPRNFVASSMSRPNTQCTCGRQAIFDKRESYLRKFRGVKFSIRTLMLKNSSDIILRHTAPKRNLQDSFRIERIRLLSSPITEQCPSSSKLTGGYL